MDRVTFEGSVIDLESRRPVARATVRVRPLASGANGNVAQPGGPIEVTTDDSGRFQFELPAHLTDRPGAYLSIRASHPEFAALAAGCGVRERVLSPLELMPGDAVTGRVVDARGEPVTGAAVRYTTVGGPYDLRFMAVPPHRTDDRTTTDADGRFRFNAIRGAAVTDLWVETDDHAVLHHAVRDQRSDLGTFRLEGGRRVAGVVRLGDGSPAAGIGVRLESVERNAVQNGVTSRHARADEQGRFTLAPVKAGAYVLTVTETVAMSPDGERVVVRLPAAFAPVKLTVTWEDDSPVEVRATPQVVVRARYVDSGGDPVAGHGGFVVGRWEGAVYSAKAMTNGERSTIEAVVPRGLTDAALMPVVDVEYAYAHRRGGVARKSAEVPLGTLTEDVTDLVITRYRAPQLNVRAVDPDGTPVERFTPRVTYTSGAMPPHRGEWISGVGGDVDFERQPDGAWRSRMLMPGEPLHVTVDAEGYEASAEAVTLDEGDVRELAIALTPSDH